MMRARVREGLIGLRDKGGDRLTLRVSVDHYTAKLHDEERGTGTFEITLQGMRWLRDNGFRMAVAGRTMWGEDEAQTRAGFGRLFASETSRSTRQHPLETVLFPEMDETVDVPEITTACWGILHKDPGDVMCASSRMVIKRKGADRPSVVACTLLPYDPQFELGATLAEARAR